MIKIINKEKILNDFHKMLDEHWKYEKNAARYGVVDCSGAFTYSFDLNGLYIPHGSNAIARKYVLGLIPISEAKLESAMFVFKALKPGEDGYNLPDTYKNDTDQNDYYHIGLLDDDLITVLNAQSTSTGFVRSKLSDGWDFVAYAKDLIYGGGEKQVIDMKATVVAQSGSTVNMRKDMRTNSDLIERVPVGAKIIVNQDYLTWCKVTYNGKSGYMVSNYIDFDDLPEDVDDDPAWKEKVQQARDILDEVLKGA